jgi:transposase
VQPARRWASRPALQAQVHAWAQAGLSYSAIARQLGMHRVTVKAWLQQAPAAAATPAPASPGEPASTGEADPHLLMKRATHRAPPPAPWTSWEEVQQVREAVQEHHFLLLRRPEHLNGEQQAQVAALLTSPLGPQLQVARRFLEEWYRLWTDEGGQRRTLEEAFARYIAWQTNPGVCGGPSTPTSPGAGNTNPLYSSKPVFAPAQLGSDQQWGGACRTGLSPPASATLQPAHSGNHRRRTDGRRRSTESGSDSLSNPVDLSLPTWSEAPQ